MEWTAITALILVCVFYVAYIGKQVALRVRGIRGSRLGKGGKQGMVLTIEMLLLVATYAMAAVQLVSLLGIFPSAALPLWARSMGLACLLLADIVFCLSLLAMKDSWRAGIDLSTQTKMVTGGIYHFSRNPAFLAFDLMYIGTMLVVPNASTLAIGMACIILLHFQILHEEAFLPMVFGEEYLAYAARTPRYFGFL